MKKVLTVTIVSLSSLIFADNNIENLLPSKSKMIAIKAGSRSLKENELHKLICQKDGAIDVTDLADIQVTSGVLDAVMCISPNKINPTAGAISSSVQGVNLAAYAPSGQVGTGPYWIKGGATFLNAHIGSGLAMEVGVTQ